MQPVNASDKQPRLLEAVDDLVDQDMGADLHSRRRSPGRVAGEPHPIVGILSYHEILTSTPGE